MNVLLPSLVWVVVFCAVLAVGRRAPRAVLRLERHQVVGIAGPSVGVPQVGRSLLGFGARVSVAGALATRFTPREVRTRAGKLLLEAGSPMSLPSYLLVRGVFMFVIAPLVAFYLLANLGASLPTFFVAGVGGFAFAYLPLIYVRGKAKRRARAIEQAMPDALDLLVVCVEGGLSLDGSILQVARRTNSVLAAELRRFQSDVSTGMARRDAFQGLAARTPRSESLAFFCATMVQADKLGMSIASTLRTLAETMRTRRRQHAETQARKAPLKMLPCIIFFMIPPFFVVILMPAVFNFIGMARGLGL